MDANEIYERIVSEHRFVYIAGPCAVESADQIMKAAKFLAGKGVPVLRGGAFKPRTDPESFQGLGAEALEYLAEAREETGMLVATELLDYDMMPLFQNTVDFIQIGSRNCQNFPLLKKVGRMNKPVILKRGFGNTIDEFIKAARYITREGNSRVILVERGIRTFESATRFTLDVSSIPVIKEKSEFPIIVDPSHPAGFARYVEPLALAGVAAGADGLMVEVHPDPRKALSDPLQQINFKSFSGLMEKTETIIGSLGRVSLRLEEHQRGQYDIYK